MHPSYSPDLELSDYYLFSTMANDFAGKIFALREVCARRLTVILPVGTNFTREA